MFVYKYPDWLAEIIYNDDSVEFFDGAKDLFKFYFNPDKYPVRQESKRYRSPLCSWNTMT